MDGQNGEGGKGFLYLGNGGKRGGGFGGGGGRSRKEKKRKSTRLVEVVEGTPGGTEGAMKMIPVEEEEDHITPEKISKMNAVIIQLGMAT